MTQCHNSKKALLKTKEGHGRQGVGLTGLSLTFPRPPPPLPPLPLEAKVTPAAPECRDYPGRPGSANGKQSKEAPKLSSGNTYRDEGMPVRALSHSTVSCLSLKEREGFGIHVEPQGCALLQDELFVLERVAMGIFTSPICGIVSGHLCHPLLLRVVTTLGEKSQHSHPPNPPRSAVRSSLTHHDHPHETIGDHEAWYRRSLSTPSRNKQVPACPGYEVKCPELSLPPSPSLPLSRLYLWLCRPPPGPPQCLAPAARLGQRAEAISSPKSIVGLQRDFPFSDKRGTASRVLTRALDLSPRARGCILKTAV